MEKIDFDETCSLEGLIQIRKIRFPGMTEIQDEGVGGAEFMRRLGKFQNRILEGDIALAIQRNRGHEKAAGGEQFSNLANNFVRIIKMFDDMI